MSRILIAADAQGVSCMERILAGRHELIIASTLAQALAALKDRVFDLILIGVHFDESRMFDFLSAIHRGHATEKPIICFCARDTQITRTMHQSIDAVSATLGAWMYLDQHVFNVTQHPDAEMQRIIERCLTGEARKEIQLGRMELHKQREELLRLRVALQGESWSVDLEDRVSQLRDKLSQVLLDLSTLQHESIAQQQKTDESSEVARPSVVAGETRRDCHAAG